MDCGSGSLDLHHVLIPNRVLFYGYIYPSEMTFEFSTLRLTGGTAALLSLVSVANILHPQGYYSAFTARVYDKGWHPCVQPQWGP